jgi:hypothetical protein
MRTIINWINRERPARQFPLSDFDRLSRVLTPCDVILVEGRTRVSDIIRWLTNSPWTHAALFIGRIDDIQDDALRARVASLYQGSSGDRLIVESLLGHGTVVRALSVYDCEHLRICRPSRLSLDDAANVTRSAISHVGLDYDVRQILDLARFLFPWFLLPRKWASTLFLQRAGKPEKTVCSTMIAESFGKVNFPILPLVKQTEEGKPRFFRRNPKLCTPSDFDYSPYFEIIKYPFMDFNHEDYQLLPWKGAGMLSAEEADIYIESDEDPNPGDQSYR